MRNRRLIRIYCTLLILGIASFFSLFILTGNGYFGEMPEFEQLENPNTNLATQIISSDGQSIIATASTISREIKKDLSLTSNKEAAALVGKLIAEKSKSKGIEKVAFDRSGFKYHGRVKALAEAAREAGLNF